MASAKRLLNKEAWLVASAIFPFLLMVCLWLGCGGGTSGTEAGMDVTITYDGKIANHGQPLAVAVYETYPPKGPPLTYKVVEDYSFPSTVRFEGLPPGEYVVGASIDLDPSDTPHVGMLKAGVDPFGYAGQAKKIQIQHDTPPTSIGVTLQTPR